MRIRVVMTFTVPTPLLAGRQFDLDPTIGMLLVTEEWAERVEDGEEKSGAQPVRPETDLMSLDEAIASDIALDEVVAGAIERQSRTRR